jgi:YD repeat-containing protein
MRLSQWFTPMALLAALVSPDTTLAASCDASQSRASVIGIEFVATAGPNGSGEYRYESIDLHCDSEAAVTPYTWPYSFDFGWHHPDTFFDTLPISGYRTNHRIFVNRCGTRLVGVNDKFTGNVGDIDLSLSNFPMQPDIYEDQFEQPLHIEYGPNIASCDAPPPPPNENLGKKGDCSLPMVDDNINASSGNNFYREEDTNDSDLSFERVYNSQALAEGALGPNWQHNFEQSLTMRDNSITAVRPDGRVVTFAPADNGWSSPQDPTARIQPSTPDASGYAYTDRDGSVDTFDGNGTWLSTTRYNGTVLRGVYAGSQLRSILDQHGNTIELEYEAGQLIKVTTPGQHAITYSYQQNGLLAAVTRPDESSRHYHYEDESSKSMLTGITDSRGKQLATWQYDDQQRVTALFQGSDTGTFSDNANNHTMAYEATSTQVTNPLGKQTLYHFTQLEDTRRVAHVEGLSTDNCISANRYYSYHPNGQLHSKTDSNGNTTSYSYNGRGLQSERADALGSPEQRTIATQWHPLINKPQTIAESSRQTSYAYDAFGRLLAKTLTDTSAHQSKPRNWSYEYNEQGRLIRLDGPRTDSDDSWRFKYDSAGNISRLLNPLGHSIALSAYNGAGQPTEITDNNGVSQSLGYDQLGRLRTSQVAGLLTTVDYNDAHQITRLVLPGTGTIDYSYDAAGRLIGITNSQGETISYTLDTAGNQLSRTIKDHNGVVVFQGGSRFDELNRLREDLNAASQAKQSYSYDAQGNRIEDVEPLGARTSRLYDALNRITQITQRDLGVTTFTYDKLDRLATVVDPRGLQTDYDYDGLGNLLHLSSPDTGVTRYDYDTAGNMTQRIDARGVIAHYRYDALNRLSHITYPDDPWLNIAYHYDNTAQNNYGIGRLTGIDDASGSTALIYDAMGRVVQKTIVLGMQTYQWAYAYHPSGQLASIQSPSGLELVYRHDEHGLLRSVASRQASTEQQQLLLDGIEWYPFGTLKKWRFGNDIETLFSHDEDNRLRELHTTGANPVIQRNYRYNPLQDISHIDDQLQSSASQILHYDPQHRLQQATGNYGNISYSYDEVGNRLSLTLDKHNTREHRSYHYSPDSNQLDRFTISVAGEQSESLVSYDANGNVIASANQSFSYSNANRMSHSSDGGHSRVMSYNALGQRVIIAQGSELQHFHYDSQGRLIALSDGSSGNVTHEYIYAAGQLIAIIDHRVVDSDADGLDDEWELQHFGDLHHDGDADADNDLLNDRLEYQYGFDPTSADGGSHGDNGILNIWEQHFFQQIEIDPHADADGDGVSNRDEYRQLTDPTDSTDQLNPAGWLIPLFY